MEVTEKQLRERYVSLETEELIELAGEGQLTDLAQTVVVEVLASRGLEETEIKSLLVNSDVEEPIELIPVRSSLPHLWPGFAVAIAILLGEIVVVMLYPYSQFSFGLIFISVVGAIYWIFCVYRIHKILAGATNHRYPISPGRAIGFHFIPIFNFYWIFHWPHQLAVFLNRFSDKCTMNNVWPGALLVVSFFCNVFVDRALGLILSYSVLVYIFQKIKIAIRLLPHAQ